MSIPRCRECPTLVLPGQLFCSEDCAMQYQLAKEAEEEFDMNLAGREKLEIPGEYIV